MTFKCGCDRLFRSMIVFCVCSPIWLTGCGGGSTTRPTVDSNRATAQADSEVSESADDSSPRKTKPKPKFDAITLGGDSGSKSASSGSVPGTEAEEMESVVQAMQPLQIMLGKWRGTTNQKFKGFSAVEELEWIWDFRSNRAQPALVVKSDKSPYMREGRLTYLTADKTFQLTATTPEGVQHVMRGKFEREPDEFTGDDSKPQKTYKLLLTEDEPVGGEAWQVAFDQQENNRYLVQLSRKRGTGNFQLADTVGTQRLGTSFAASDDDYGDKKCIISGGLGVSTVSYNGKSYWVCCSGCQAAFNEDPKRWVAKMEEADKAKAAKK
jgi:hypothetical protein